MFKTDAGGVAFRATDWKLSFGAATYGTRLSQAHRFPGTIRILTYSLPSLEYVDRQFQRRSMDTWLICHSKFVSRAQEIKRRFEFLRIAHRPDLHAKLLLVAPATLWIGSANFGSSHWEELMAGIHSRTAHDAAAKHFEALWRGATEIV